MTGISSKILRFLACFCLAVVFSFSAIAQETRSEILIQNSPLAGFKYYEGKDLWAEMKLGDELALIRELDNRFDANAIRVEWQGHMLGYVPRRENQVLAKQMDNGTVVKARIIKLQKHRNPWKRIEFEVFVEMK